MKDLRSWAILLLIGATHYGTPHMGTEHWYAWASSMGLMTAVLLWFVRGPRLSMMWFACMWGIVESSMVFVCQGVGFWAGTVADGVQGVCGKQLGFPTTAITATIMLALAVLWLDRNKRRDSTSRV